MSDADPAPSPVEPAQLLRRAAPTWEVELLISGVAVFAMLQLPGWLNDWAQALLPRLQADLRMPVQVLFLYLEVASLVLSLTFAVQLMLRAQWIARVGMHSVYPDGVRWDNLGGGPIARRVAMQLAGDVQRAIERADDRASIVFAVGVSMATSLLLLSLALLALFLTGYGLSWLLGLPFDGDRMFMVASALVVLPWGLAVTIDQAFGRHIRPDGWFGRGLARVLRCYAAAGFDSGASVTGPLTSHVGPWRSTLAVTLVMFACLAAAGAFVVAGEHADRLGSYGLFPEFRADSPHAMLDAHYDDRRDPLRDAPVPFVQGAVIRGPYLRLVVPYRPERAMGAQQAQCPDAIATDGDAARAAALLECLGGMHALALDGQPLAVGYVAGSDARTNRPALVAMIDVRQLAAGRHELTVRRVPRAKGAARDAEVGEDRILFWR